MDACEVTLEDEAWFDGYKDYQTVREIPGMSDPEKTRIQEVPDRKRGVQVRLIVVICILTVYTLATILPLQDVQVETGRALTSGIEHRE